MEGAEDRRFYPDFSRPRYRASLHWGAVQRFFDLERAPSGVVIGDGLDAGQEQFILFDQHAGEFGSLSAFEPSP